MAKYLVTISWDAVVEIEADDEDTAKSMVEGSIDEYLPEDPEVVSVELDKE